MQMLLMFSIETRVFTSTNRQYRPAISHQGRPSHDVAMDDQKRRHPTAHLQQKWWEIAKTWRSQTGVDPPRQCYLQCVQIKANQCLEVTKFILRDLSIFFRKTQDFGELPWQNPPEPKEGFLKYSNWAMKNKDPCNGLLVSPYICVE